MTGRNRCRRWVVFAVALAALVAAAPGYGADEDDPIEARAYRIRYRPAADAAELAAAVLSPEGSVTLKPRFQTLVVQDRASVLERVAAVLADFDLPPRSLEVAVSLFLGSEAPRPQDEAGRHAPREGPYRELRGILETLPNITKWTAFEPLGSRAVVGVEGSVVTADLSDGYRIAFEVESVDEHDRVKFRTFSLQRVIREEGGGETVENVYTNEIVIDAGRTLMVGAAQAPHSKRALFLTLQANPR